MTKVALQAGEERMVSFQLEKRDFAYYDAYRNDWVVIQHRPIWPPDPQVFAGLSVLAITLRALS